jgi:hypothetical protein
LSEAADSANESAVGQIFAGIDHEGDFDAGVFCDGGRLGRKAMMGHGGAGLPLLAAAALTLTLSACAQTTYGTGRTAGLQTITDFARAGALTGEAKDPIDFAPRAPIVAPPPGAPLPPPGGDTTGSTALAANWPKDPDAQAAAVKAEIAEANASGRRIRMLPAANASAPPPVDPNSPENFKPATPEQIAEYRRIEAMLNGATTDADGNPVRVYLSDPPPGYMIPDPNAPPVTTAEEQAAPQPRLRWPWQWFRRS